MITLENVTVSIDGKPLFAPISLSLLGGAILNIHGGNGIGKTTLLKALATLRPIHGTVKYNDQDVSKHLNEYRQLLNYLGHEDGLYASMSIAQNLATMAALTDFNLAVDAAVHTFDLGEYLDHKPGQLSKGWRKKVALCQLFFKDAQLLLIDEPFANLDPEAQSLLWNIFKSRAGLSAILIFTSHEKQNMSGVIDLELQAASGVG